MEYTIDIPSSVNSSLFYIGIALLIMITLGTVVILIKYKRKEKRLSKKWIILFLLLTYCIPIVKEEWCIGCFGHPIRYKNIYGIRIWEKY